MAIGLHQERMIFQHIDQQIFRGVHHCHHPPAVQLLHNASVNIVRHGMRYASRQNQHVAFSQAVQLLHQQSRCLCANIRSAAVNLRTVNGLQLQVDP